MRATKHLLFVAGLVGVVAMFMPMFSLGKNLTYVEISARDLTFGLAHTHQLLDQDIPGPLRKHLGDVATARDDIRTVLEALRVAALAYIPAGLLLLIGVLGFWRGTVARWLAAVAIVCGMASIAAYFAVVYGIDYGKGTEPLLRRVNLVPALGAYLLIVAGAGGITGGIAGLLRRR